MAEPPYNRQNGLCGLYDEANRGLGACSFDQTNRRSNRCGDPERVEKCPVRLYRLSHLLRSDPGLQFLFK